MYKHCPICGHHLAVERRDDQNVPICQNPNCGFVFWQNSKPCVSVLIPDEYNRILMAVRASAPDKGKLDLPGGFLLEGEHPDDGAHREIQEELGVEISLGEYIGFATDQYEEVGKYSYYTLTLCMIGKITKGTPRAMDDVAGIEWMNPKDISPDTLAFTSNQKFIKLWLEQENTN